MTHPNTTELVRLAERVEALGDITCPMCGDEGFDAPGFSNHITRWCEVEWAINSGAFGSNSEVAAALRARAVSGEASIDGNRR